MEQKIIIQDGLTVEMTYDHLQTAIVENLNEDQIFDIIQHAIRKNKMFSRTVFERICDDFSYEIEELIDKKLNK